MDPVRIVDLSFSLLFCCHPRPNAFDLLHIYIFLFSSSSSSLLFVWFVAKRLFLRPLWANFREQLVVARFEFPTNNNIARALLKHSNAGTHTHAHTFVVV